MKDNESKKRIDKKEVKALKSLGNCDVMEHLASYLNNQDLGSLYDTCVTIADGIDALSLWRKRALKLTKILGSKKGGLKKRFGCKSEESAHYRDLCYIRQECLKIQVDTLREAMNSGRKLCQENITDAARLAHHGMLGSVQSMQWRVNLTSVPSEHLASLVSSVTEYVCIDNVRLSSKETWALVRAMESSVKLVVLGGCGKVSLDITALTQYSGQGKCRQMEWYFEPADREEVMSWAQKMRWEVSVMRDKYTVIEMMRT